MIGQFLYGTGARLLEGLRLRIKDVDFGQGRVIVREGKGMKDRVTMLPESLRTALRAHLHREGGRRMSDGGWRACFGE